MNIFGELNTLDEINKIAIWGPPSSGKTYMAKKLAKKFNINNVIHSDDFLTWDKNKKWIFIPKQEFLKRVNPLLDKPKWIVEGNLGEHISREQVLKEADLVVILNPSYIKLFFRLLTRSITRNSRIRLGHHTVENAIVAEDFTFNNIIEDSIDSIKIIQSFKKSYIHYLIETAKKSSNLSKVRIIS